MAGWRSAAEQHAPLTTQDRDLRDAGLWFFNEFERLRAALQSQALDRLPRALRMRLAIGFVNRDYREAFNQTAAAAEATLSADGVIDISAPLTVSSSGPFNLLMPVDDAISSGVDLARLVLRDAMAAPNATQPHGFNDIELLRRAHAMVVLANMYEVLETNWHAVLWNNYRLESRGVDWLLIPGDYPAARATAAWAFREQQRSIEAAHRSARLEVGGVRASTQASRTIIALEVNGEDIRLTVGDRPQESVRRPIELSIVLLADEFLSGVGLPPFGEDRELDVPLLISAWGVLHDLILLLHPPSLDTTVMTTEQLLSHAPLISRARLVQALSDSLSIPLKRAAAIVRFFTFDPRERAGLWGHPIVSVTEDEITIVASSVVAGNVIRAIEHWLRRAKISFTERGAVVEQEVRDVISAAIAASRTLTAATSTRTSLIIGGEEIDVLIRIGRRLVVGEIKCSVFPSEPLELHNYMVEQIDESAVPQAKRKAKAVAEHIEQAANALGIAADDLDRERVAPIVIVNHVMGTGLPRDGVPVCNTDYLIRYLVNGVWEFHVVINAVGESTAQFTLPLYTSQDDADRTCLDAFGQHPAMAMLLEGCTERARPIPLADGGTLYFVHFAVEAYPELEETKKFFAKPLGSEK